MPRIVSVKDCCFLQGLLQPEVFQGLAGSGLPHESDGMGADRRLVLDSCARAVCLSQMELMVKLHVDRRRDRAVTRMEKLTLELPT